MKTNSNILIIANKKIFPTLDGGAMAMKKMSELLLAQNYKVDIVCISKQNKPSKANNPIIKKIDRLGYEIGSHTHMHQLMYELRQGLLRKHFGLGDQKLFKHSRVGTKLILEEYIDFSTTFA